jgi:hypothetical protein
MEPQSEHLCKAEIEQGVNKGKRCTRPRLDNGYCGKHIVNSKLENAKKEGKRKCSRFRCTETFIAQTDKQIEYCNACKEAKKDHLESIILCKWSEIKCKRPAKENGFCGKHEPRGVLLESAKEKGIRICDDGKRSCKNTTTDNKLKCEQCLEKNRAIENKQNMKRRENLSLCLTCGKELEGLTDGIRGKVQRCLECYEKQRNVEMSRERNRNYLEEKKANLDKYLISYTQCAKVRNIGFELSNDEFQELVLMACYYCGSYNEKEVVGIDRLNSSKNYTLDNCVPCCKTCNFMKGGLSKHRFITQAHKISTQHPVEDMSESEDEVQEEFISSRISPSKVAELYRRGKLNIYIEACIREKRSSIFIERLKTIKEKMSYNDFKKLFRSYCKSESKFSSITMTSDRKRISYKEIYGYINNKSSEYAIELYQSVHGILPGFKEDIEDIVSLWDTITFDERMSRIYKTMIKYQNKRAHGTLENTLVIPQELKVESANPLYSI